MADRAMLIDLWRALAKALLTAVQGDPSKMKSQHLAVARQFLLDNGIGLKNGGRLDAQEALSTLVDQMPDFDAPADSDLH